MKLRDSDFIPALSLYIGLVSDFSVYRSDISLLECTLERGYSSYGWRTL